MDENTRLLAKQVKDADMSDIQRWAEGEPCDKHRWDSFQEMGSGYDFFTCCLDCNYINIERYDEESGDKYEDLIVNYLGFYEMTGWCDIYQLPVVPTSSQAKALLALYTLQNVDDGLLEQIVRVIIKEFAPEFDSVIATHEARANLASN